MRQIGKKNPESISIMTSITTPTKPKHLPSTYYHTHPVNLLPIQTSSPTSNFPQIPPLSARNSKLKWPKRFSSPGAYRLFIFALFLFSFTLTITITTIRNYNYVSSSPSSFSTSNGPHRLKLAVPLDNPLNNQNNFFSDKHTTTATELSADVRGNYQLDSDSQSLSSSNDAQKKDTDMESIRADFQRVIIEFMDTAPLSSFDYDTIIKHYHEDHNNMKRTAMLVTISNGVVNYTTDFPSSQHGRSESVKYVIDKIISDRAAKKNPPLPNATFLVMVTDGHGAKVATFGSARHWKHWINLIPVPMGNRRGMSNGWGTLLNGWDNYVKTHVTDTHKNFTWESKIEKAFFRGALSMQTYKLGTCNEEHGHMCETARNWTEINRGVLYLRSRDSPDLFDVGFTSVKSKDNSPPNAMVNAPRPIDSIPFVQYQRYKYILNVGNNQDWAERLRNLLFTNSAIIMHEAETREFFMPLMKPWVHYIPTNLMMTDLADHIRWAKKNDNKVRQIVRNQLALANRYIRHDSMELYWELAIEQFSQRQKQFAQSQSRG